MRATRNPHRQRRCSTPRARSGSRVSAPPSSRATGRSRKRATCSASLVKEGTAVESRTIRMVGDRLDRVRRGQHAVEARAHRDARKTADTAVTLVQIEPPERASCPRCCVGARQGRAGERSARPSARKAAKPVKRVASRARHARRSKSPLPFAREGSVAQERSADANEENHAGNARGPARAHACPERAARATERAASVSRSPAAGRSAASTRSARCSRSPIRSTASISTSSTPTSACRPAASSPPRSPTASRRRRCTGCSSRTAPTRRSSPRSSCGPRSASSAAASPRCPASSRARRCSTCATRSIAACWSRSPRSRSAIPTGVFDNRAIDAFLARLFAAPGRTNDFRKLPRKLFLVATNLDTGASVVFGSRRARARADLARDRGVERAARPVPAGGDRRRALRRRRAQQDAARVGRARRGRHAAAVRQPARAVRRERRRTSRRLTVDKLNQGGLPLVLGQTFRAIIHSRMQRRHGAVPRPVPGCAHRAVRARPRGRRHVLREHLQLPAAQAPVRASRSPRRAQASPRARKRAGAALRAPRHRAPPRPPRRPGRARRRTRSPTRGRCARDPRAKRTVQRTARELAHTLDQLERAVAAAR